LQRDAIAAIVDVGGRIDPEIATLFVKNVLHQFAADVTPVPTTESKKAKRQWL
jgi:hypothetical protein